jgi:LysR family nitrogen assimilation transcriptional regulator
MELRQLRQYVATVDAGGLSQGAERIGAGQSALSQSISNLEEELGLPLLIRGPRGTVPTEAGAAFYHHAQQILRMADDTAQAILRRTHTASGRVRLGMPISIGRMLAQPLITRLAELYPEITLEIDEHMATFGAASLLNERIDLAILLNDESLTAEVESVPLLHERIWFVRRREPGQPLPRTVTLATAVDYPLVLTTPTTSFRAIVARQFGLAELRPVVAAEANSAQTLVGLVADGVGASLLPYSVFAPNARSAELEYGLIEPAFHRVASVAHSKLNPLALAAESVRALIFEVTAQLIHSGQWKAASMSDHRE